MARDWWQKGRAFDLWSIPHFLFGILMGFVPALVDSVSFSFALVLTLVLAVLWELFEMRVGIRETVLNSLLDVFLPVAAYIITSYVLLLQPYHREDIAVVSIAVLILYLFTNISGWLAYRRRSRDFTY
ncbi:MAG: hypothetical protein G01um101491_62 [Parcubacteria group bacterium Gr01-1014_91]|nr:MAG: hypothetical protein G01um101491_62 [Parcubacteria group bacterium Gr01-1014_91]